MGEKMMEPRCSNCNAVVHEYFVYYYKNKRVILCEDCAKNQKIVEEVLSREFGFTPRKEKSGVIMYIVIVFEDDVSDDVIKEMRDEIVSEIANKFSTTKTFFPERMFPNKPVVMAVTDVEKYIIVEFRNNWTKHDFNRIATPIVKLAMRDNWLVHVKRIKIQMGD